MRRHPPEREEIELPLRGKPLRDKLVLRLIALDRGFHFVVLCALGVLVLLFAADIVCGLLYARTQGAADPASIPSSSKRSAADGTPQPGS